MWILPVAKASGFGASVSEFSIASKHTGPFSVHASDVDGDSDMDLTVAYVDNGTVVWIENFGALNFSKVHTVDAAIDGASSAQGIDVDGDGDTDIVATGESDDTVQWYENDGSEVFTKHIISSSAGGAFSLHALDMNGDNFTDIAVATQNDGTVSIYRQNPPHTNFTQVDVTTSLGAAAAVYCADFNGDSIPDVVAMSSALGVVRWYENDGDLGFTVKPSILTEFSGVGSLFATDVDLDGDTDVLVAGNSVNRLVFLANNGSGSFNATDISSNAAGAFSVHAADLDDDGDVDIVAALSGSNQFIWFQNDGISNFDNGTILSNEASYARAVYAADYDSDGDNDVVGVSTSDNTARGFEFTPSTGPTVPPSVSPSAVPSASPSQAPSTSPTANPSTTPTLVPSALPSGSPTAAPSSAPTGAFTTFSRLNVTTALGGAFSTFAIDMDDDGDVDVLGAGVDGDVLAWLENAGDSETFTLHNVVTGFDGASCVYATDVDGDGDVDVLGTAENADVVAWYENDGTQNFTEHILSSESNGAFSVFAVDVTGDSHIDVLSASQFDDTVMLFVNNGSEDFSLSVPISVAADGASSVYALDVDSDGDVDVLSSSNGDNTIAWYQNDNNTLNFTEHVVTTGASSAMFVFAIDLDTDSDVDILSASSGDHTIAWYENDGFQSFTTHIITSSATGAFSCYAIDLDSDGDVDVLSASTNDNTVAWYENDGSETFTTHVLDSGAKFAKAVFAIDVDLDTDVDILAASIADSTIQLFSNLDIQESASTAPSTSPSVVSSTGSPSASPSGSLSQSPSGSPSASPSRSPTVSPSGSVVSAAPSASPSATSTATVCVNVTTTVAGSTGLFYYTFRSGSQAVTSTVLTDSDGLGYVPVTPSFTICPTDLPGTRNAIVVGAGPAIEGSFEWCGRVLHIPGVVYFENDQPCALVNDYSNTALGSCAFGTVPALVGMFSSHASGGWGQYAWEIRNATTGAVSASGTLPEGTYSNFSQQVCLSPSSRCDYSFHIVNTTVSTSVVAASAIRWAFADEFNGTAASGSASNRPFCAFDNYLTFNTSTNTQSENMARVSGSMSIAKIQDTDCESLQSSDEFEPTIIDGLADIADTSADLVTLGDISCETVSGRRRRQLQQREWTSGLQQDRELIHRALLYSQTVTFDFAVDKAFNTSQNATETEKTLLDTMTNDTVITKAIRSTAVDAVFAPMSNVEADSSNVTSEGTVSALVVRVETTTQAPSMAPTISPTSGSSTVFTGRVISASFDQGFMDTYVTDMDNDGDEDIVAAAYKKESILWYENDGAESFTKQFVSASAGSVWAVSAGDLDSDGDMDALAVSESNGTATWYENDGTQSFAMHIVASGMNGPRDILAHDLDNDDDLDIVVAVGSDGEILLFENEGNATFNVTTIVSSIVFGATSVAVGDVDGDGDMDLFASAFQSDTVYWFEQTSLPLNFSSHTLDSGLLGPQTVITSDLDGDNDTDVLVAYFSNNSVVWYENEDGNGSFAVARTLASGLDGAADVSVGDFDLDSDQDVVVAVYNAGDVVWLENDGEEAFTTQTLTNNTPSASTVFATDLDGDGDTDFVSGAFNGVLFWADSRVLSLSPTSMPTSSPAVLPTFSPSGVPTASPSSIPTPSPTVSHAPTPTPTLLPSVFPTATPTSAPSGAPSAFPSLVPSASPTVSAAPTGSAMPTASPTVQPSASPTASPMPSATPTSVPTASPSGLPTPAPSGSMFPSAAPSAAPTLQPSVQPSALPSLVPSVAPSGSPSAAPSAAPTEVALQYLSGNWSQDPKLSSSSLAASDAFGTAVAINTRYAMVGADNADNAGQVYVFTASPYSGNWSQTQTLMAADASNNAGFGATVHLGTSIAVVGAPLADGANKSTGAVYIFTLKPLEETWVQQQKLFDASIAIAKTGDTFGRSIATSPNEDYIAVGAPGETAAGDPIGAVYMFARNSSTGNWTQTQRLSPGDALGSAIEFGHAVALTTDLLVVGATNEEFDGVNAGTARVYSLNKTTGNWSFVQQLTASDFSSNDGFGSAVAVSSALQVIVVGAYQAPHNTEPVGGVYVFTPLGATQFWTQTDKLVAPDASIVSMAFGASIALSDSGALAASASLDNYVASTAGAVYVFRRRPASTGNFSFEQKLVAADGASGDGFGSDVDINGSTILVGASAADGPGLLDAGYAYVFRDNFVATQNSASPTVVPTAVPSDAPTLVPSPAPTSAPTVDLPEFTQSYIASSVYGVYAVFAVDLDSDGDQDVLSAAMSANRVYWHEFNGTAYEQHTLASPYGSSDVYAADLDGDGDVDVITAAFYSGIISWLENDGSQNFREDNITFDAMYVASVFAADVNGDGDMDILSASRQDDLVAWYRNNGNGKFSSSRSISRSVNGATVVYAVDLDDDGDTDVVSGAAAGNAFYWHENDGSQDFTQHNLSSAEFPTALEVVDLDGDGDLDIVASSQYDDSIRWYKNDGAGGFTTRFITKALDGAYSVDCADIDRDGDIDCAAVASDSNYVVWYDNEGPPSYNFTERYINYLFFPVDVFAEDMDGDNDIDVIGAGYSAGDIRLYTSDVLELTHSPSSVPTPAPTAVDFFEPAQAAGRYAEHDRTSTESKSFTFHALAADRSVRPTLREQAEFSWNQTCTAFRQFVSGVTNMSNAIDEGTVRYTARNLSVTASSYFESVNFVGLYEDVEFSCANGTAVAGIMEAIALYETMNKTERYSVFTECEDPSSGHVNMWTVAKCGGVGAMELCVNCTAPCQCALNNGTDSTRVPFVARFCDDIVDVTGGLRRDLQCNDDNTVTVADIALNLSRDSLAGEYANLSATCDGMEDKLCFTDLVDQASMEEGTCSAWSDQLIETSLTVLGDEESVQVVGLTVTAVAHEPEAHSVDYSCGHGHTARQIAAALVAGSAKTFTCDDDATVVRTYTCSKSLSVGSSEAVGLCLNCTASDATAACAGSLTSVAASTSTALVTSVVPCATTPANVDLYATRQVGFLWDEVAGPTVRIVDVDAETSSLSVVVNSTSSGIVYCAAIDASTLVETTAQVQAAGSSVILNSAGFSHFSLSGLTPLTVYSVYCFAESFDGVTTSVSNMLEQTQNATTGCCHPTSLSGTPTSSLSVGDTTEALTVTLDAAPSSFVLIEVLAYVDTGRAAGSSSACRTSSQADLALAPASSIAMTPQYTHATEDDVVLSFDFLATVYNATCYYFGANITAASASEFDDVAPNDASTSAGTLVLVLDDEVTPPPPVLESATFTSTGNRIRFQFDTETDSGDAVGLKTKFGCDALFNFTGAPAYSCLFSSAALATGTFDAATAAALGIPDDDLPVGGDSVTLLPNTIQALCQDDGACSDYPFANSTVVNLTVPSDAQSPSISISAPSEIGLCAALTLDATSSSGAGGRDFVLTNWTLELATGNVSDKNVSDVRFQLKNASVFGDLSPTIPSYALVSGASYTFALQLFNFMEQSSVALTQPVSVATDPNVPNVVIVGADFRTVFINASMSFFAQADPASCAAERSLVLVYEWIVFDESYEEVEVTALDGDPRYLEIAPFDSALSPESSYTARVTVSSPSSGSSSFDEFEFFVRRSNIVAVIDDGQVRSVSEAENFIVDASASFDPDVGGRTGEAAGLRMTWTCVEVSPVFGAACANTTGHTLALTDNETLFVPAGQLEGNSTYKFTVVASATDGTSAKAGTTSVLITVTLSNPPSVSIAVDGVKVDATRAFALEGAVGVSNVATRGTWTLVDGTLADGVSLGQAATTQLSRTFSVPNDNKDTDISFSFPLKLAANQLLEGVTYTFQLKVFDASLRSTTSQSAFARVEILTNAPPSSGVFSVSPSSGVAFNDSLLLTASAWVDDNTDLPLTYRFSFKIGRETSRDGALVVQARSERRTVSSTFPEGDRTQGNAITMFLGIFDIFNASSTASKEATVTASDATREKVQTLVTNQLSRAFEESDLDAVFSTSNSASVTLNAANCSLLQVNCSALHREECFATANTCGECKSGFRGTPGADNSACFAANATYTVTGGACSSDAECEYQLCRNFICTAPTLECPNNCTNQGQCVYYDINDRLWTDNGGVCTAADSVQCYGVCVCNSTWNGEDCSLNDDDFNATLSLRLTVLESLFNASSTQSAIETNLDSTASSLDAASTKPDELTAASSASVVDSSAVWLINSVGSDVPADATTFEQIGNALSSALTSNSLTGDTSGNADISDAVNVLLFSAQDGLVLGEDALTVTNDNLRMSAEQRYSVDTEGATFTAPVDASESTTRASSVTLSEDGFAVCGAEDEDAVGLSIVQWGIAPDDETDGNSSTVRFVAHSSTADLFSPLDRTDDASGADDTVFVLLRNAQPVSYGSYSTERVQRSCTADETNTTVNVSCSDGQLVPLTCRGRGIATQRCPSTVIQPTCNFATNGTSGSTSVCEVVNFTSTETLCECSTMEFLCSTFSGSSGASGVSSSSSLAPSARNLQSRLWQRTGVLVDPGRRRDLQRGRPLRRWKSRQLSSGEDNGGPDATAAEARRRLESDGELLVAGARSGFMEFVGVAAFVGQTFVQTFSVPETLDANTVGENIAVFLTMVGLIVLCTVFAWWGRYQDIEDEKSLLGLHVAKKAPGSGLLMLAGLKKKRAATDEFDDQANRTFGSEREKEEAEQRRRTEKLKAEGLLTEDAEPDGTHDGSGAAETVGAVAIVGGGGGSVAGRSENYGDDANDEEEEEDEEEDEEPVSDSKPAAVAILEHEETLDEDEDADSTEKLVLAASAAANRLQRAASARGLIGGSTRNAHELDELMDDWEELHEQKEEFESILDRLVAAVMPTALKEGNSLLRFTEAVKTDHDVLSVFFNYDALHVRPLRVLNLAVLVLTIMFLEAVFYFLSFPPDPGCEDLATEDECLDEKSPVESDQSLCSWNKEGKFCEYTEPEVDFETTIIIAMLANMIAFPINYFAIWVMEHIMAKPVRPNTWLPAWCAGLLNMQQPDSHGRGRRRRRDTVSSRDEEDQAEDDSRRLSLTSWLNKRRESLSDTDTDADAQSPQDAYEVAVRKKIVETEEPQGETTSAALGAESRDADSGTGGSEGGEATGNDGALVEIPLESAELDEAATEAADEVAEGERSTAGDAKTLASSPDGDSGGQGRSTIVSTEERRSKFWGRSGSRSNGSRSRSSSRSSVSQKRELLRQLDRRPSISSDLKQHMAGKPAFLALGTLRHHMTAQSAGTDLVVLGRTTLLRPDRIMYRCAVDLRESMLRQAAAAGTIVTDLPEDGAWSVSNNDEFRMLCQWLYAHRSTLTTAADREAFQEAWSLQQEGRFAPGSWLDHALRRDPARVRFRALRRARARAAQVMENRFADLSDHQQTAALLKLFAVDRLGSQLQQTVCERHLGEYLDDDDSRWEDDRPLWLLVLCWSLLSLYCLFTCLYVFLFGVQIGPRLAGQWLLGFLLAMLQEFLIYAPLIVLIMHVWIPSLVVQDVQREMHGISKSAFSNIVSRSTRDIESLFNSTAFHFVSHRVARHAPELPVSHVIMAYRSVTPRGSSVQFTGEAGRHESRSGLTASGSRGTAMQACLLSAVQVILVLPERAQDTVLGVCVPAFWAGIVILCRFMLLQHPGVLAVVVLILAVMAGASMYGSSVHNDSAKMRSFADRLHQPSELGEPHDPDVYKLGFAWDHLYNIVSGSPATDDGDGDDDADSVLSDVEAGDASRAIELTVSGSANTPTESALVEAAASPAVLLGGGHGGNESDMGGEDEEDEEEEKRSRSSASPVPRPSSAASAAAAAASAAERERSARRLAAHDRLPPFMLGLSAKSSWRSQRTSFSNLTGPTPQRPPFGYVRPRKNKRRQKAAGRPSSPSDSASPASRSTMQSPEAGASEEKQTEPGVGGASTTNTPGNGREITVKDTDKTAML